MKQLTDRLKDAVNPAPGSGNVIALLTAAFIDASIVEMFFFGVPFTDINFAKSINIAAFIIAFFAAAFITLATAMVFRTSRVIPRSLLLSAVIYSLLLVNMDKRNLWLNLGIIMILFIVFSWIYKGDKIGLEAAHLPKKFNIAASIVIFLVFSAALSWLTVLNYTAYYTPSHDFGLFAQMFDNMRETGLPYTTMERNASMSHFGVHFSPVYYLLLPFYCICPRAEMLYVMQAVAVASGVFAVYKIACHLNFSDFETFLAMAIYTLYPSLSAGLFYYFHENKFLTVFILWTVYFMLKKKTVPMFIFALLVLSVKEDAAIYIMAIAAYMLLSRREYAKGAALFALAAVWFIGAVKMVDILGEGVMSDRLKNYWPSGSEGGFADVIVNCVTNIGYLISQSFTKEKLEFMLWIFVPVLFTPFLNKKSSTLVLLVPMLAVNLMSNYVLQYSVLYQYTYGTAALVIFAFFVTAGDMAPLKRRYTLTFSSIVCAVLAVSLFSSLAMPILRLYEHTKEQCRETNEIIASIPKDADVTAHTMLAAHLADRNEVYVFPAIYGKFVESTYLLIDTRYEENCTDEYIGDYELVSSGGFCELYKLKNTD